MSKYTVYQADDEYQVDADVGVDNAYDGTPIPEITINAVFDPGGNHCSDKWIEHNREWIEAEIMEQLMGEWD